MRILFATAELRPLVSAGGLGEAAAGLTAALRSAGHEVVTVLPAYEKWQLANEETRSLDVPDWAGPVQVRTGTHADAGRLALVEAPGIERPDPYVDANGEGWEDNDERFARFACAVAALATLEAPDIVHLNDWHTALTPAFLDSTIPQVLTIHNLQHQGWAASDWLRRLPFHQANYRWGDGINMLAGAIASVDRVVAVSPNYASEIVDPANGFGLHELLQRRAEDLVGIVNGIDVRQWDPVIDSHIENFDAASIDAKEVSRSALLDHVGWSDSGEPLIAMVTRLVDQKGVDLALDATQWLAGIQARVVILGSGSRELAAQAHGAARLMPERVWFHEGYDVPLSHLMFAGADLLLMPSRFEPCGLAQMQAMAYGTIPLVTPVGGLVDTVRDADLHPNGTGFVAHGADLASIVDVLHRAVRGWRHAGRRKAIQQRGMDTDWSWIGPADRFIALYQELNTAAS